MKQGFLLNFVNFDLTFAKLLFKTLSRAERFRFFTLTGLKSLAVVIDLLALILVGAWVSMLSGSNSSFISTFVSKNMNFPFPDFMSSSTGIGLLTITLFLFKGVIAIFIDTQIANFVARVEARKSGEYLGAILDSGIEKLERFPKTKFVNSLVDAPAAAFSQGLIAYSIVVSESILLLAVSLTLFIVNPPLFLSVGLIFAVIGVLSSRFVGSGISQRARSAEVAKLRSGSLLYDIQHNARQILTLSKSQKFIDAFTRFRSEYAILNAKGLVSMTLPRYFVEFGLVLGVGVLVVLSTLNTASTPPTVIVGIFVAGIFRMVAALMPLQNQLNLLRKLFENSSELVILEKLADDVSNTVNPDLLWSTERSDVLVAENLSFSYPKSDSEVLSNLNFEIPFGAMVSIEAPSGTGKSTLADLILGLREPTSGRIGYRSKSSPEIHPAQFSTKAGYVPQRVELITGSLLENLLLEPNVEEVNIVDIQRALEKSGLADFVAGLPDGIQTRFDKQSGLSGGQIQRIGLARVLISNADVIVLDEVTSSLDKSTASEIVATIESLRGKKTIIYISHDAGSMPPPDLRIML